MKQSVIIVKLGIHEPFQVKAKCKVVAYVCHGLTGSQVWYLTTSEL